MSGTGNPGAVVAPSQLQSSVDRFARALEMPRKLLGLHPRTRGGIGNHAALSPAIVLTSISAFEGFAEEFTAQMMALRGATLADIAKRVGRWNNPTLTDFKNSTGGYFTLAASALHKGDDIELLTYPYTSTSTAVRKIETWDRVLEMSEGWMQARHVLSHGLVTGWRAEHWPNPLDPKDRPASDVLRNHGSGDYSIGLGGAISCARIYSIGARVIADAIASAYGQTLDWRALPNFPLSTERTRPAASPATAEEGSSEDASSSEGADSDGTEVAP